MYIFIYSLSSVNKVIIIIIIIIIIINIQYIICGKLALRLRRRPSIKALDQ